MVDPKAHQQNHSSTAPGSLSAQSAGLSPDLQSLTVEQCMDVIPQLHSAGHLSEAEELFQQVLLGEPEQPSTLNALGLVAGQMGNTERSQELFEQAIIIKPDFADAHFNLGTVFSHVGQLENAIASYRKALAFEPDNASAYFNLGLVLKEAGRLEDCIANYRDAIKLNPDLFQAHFDLGIVLVMCGRFEDAISSFQKCVEINPEEAGLKKLKANANLQLKMIEELLKPDFPVTVANSIENFNNDTFTKNHKKALAKQRGDNKIILVVSFPKSGSTFLAMTLKKISNHNFFRLCYRYDQNEHDLYLPYLSMWNRHGVVSLLHMKGTKPNVELINLFDIQPIITVRNIYDTIASQVNNLNQGKLDATKALGNAFLWQDEPIQALSEERKIDYMIDMAVPWCITYYVSWMYFTKTNQCQAIWVNYDKQMDNWETTLRDVCDFAGIGQNYTDPELSNFKQPRTSPYSAGNPELGVNILSEKQKMKILDMVSYYPEIDFAGHGFLNRGPDGNYSLDL